MIFNFTLLNPTSISFIYLAFVDDQQQQLLIKTPLKIIPAQWDEEKQRPTNIYLKNFKKLNTKLDALKIAIATYLSDLKSSKKDFSIRAVNRLVKKCCSEATPSLPAGGLLQSVDNFIKSRIHLITSTTHKRYLVFFRLLKRFEGYQQKHLMLDQVNGIFVQQFIAYGEAENYSVSTIHRTIHFVRTVLNFLEKRGVRTYVYELELPKVKKINRAISLSEDEISKIKNIEVPVHLKAAKDWLVISCYTGQRVSDFMNFNLDMMEILDGKPCLFFTQQKTQKSILLPLHPTALIIMSNNGHRFPHKMTAQKYNKQIKEVTRLAGITTLVKVRKRNGFRSSDQLIPKCEAITSHIGRRSFATNFYGKIPTALLMDATGHSTEQMFQRYISNVDTERTRSLGTYLENMYQNRSRPQQQPLSS
ncbi:tyrosine-type recombinase/integrase [Sphingobacterium multivorum]|uniref:tyrosine-type recombinase/integrase n=1 Tax=Sphingobacterium multivorum TaxID=28454 RepID=UPI0028B00BD8|nr:tyrosine-type recombinase/integrase [Sphingobacterium multivorum]